MRRSFIDACYRERVMEEGRRHREKQSETEGRAGRRERCKARQRRTRGLHHRFATPSAPLSVCVDLLGVSFPPPRIPHVRSLPEKEDQEQRELHKPEKADREKYGRMDAERKKSYEY